MRRHKKPIVFGSTEAIAIRMIDRSREHEDRATYLVECDECDGSGIVETDCLNCGGEGKVHERQRLPGAIAP